MKKRTIERINPDEIRNELSGNDTYKLHMDRYEFALKNLKPGNILDIACGNGYGSYFLSTALEDSDVIGVDISLEAVSFAKNKYERPNLNFIISDASEFVPDKSFDTIVSLETLEHLAKPAQFLNSIKQFLNPAGRFVASVPITYSTDVNPYHLHDFTRQTLTVMFETEGFRLVSCIKQYQKFSLLSLFSKKRKQSFEFRQNLISYYLKNPAAAFKRFRTVVQYGFKNIYIVCVFEKNA